MNSTSKIKNIYPLTPLQQGMLYHSLKDAGSEAYVEQISFDLTGEVNVSDLEWAINEFIQRHDALRTVFNIANSKQPVQVVLKDRSITLAVEDLTTLTGEALQERINAFKQADRAQGFDLIKGPLVRASCLFTGESKAHLVWSFHHIVMDGWCLPLIFKEVFQLYQQRHQGATGNLAEPTPYHHYIRWLQQRDHAGATSYWMNYLADYDQAVQVLPKRAAQSALYRLTKKSLKLSERHTNALKQLAQRSKSTMNTLMQTAWGLLLQRYNDCDDVVFGGVVSGRPAELAGVEQMIGLFINTIPVRVSARPDERVVDCIARHQQAVVASSAFDFYPLSDSQAATPLKQELINHILVFENYPVDESVAALTNGSTLPFTVDQVQIHDQTSYDLNIIVFLGERLNIHFEYNASAFEADAIDRLQRHLERLLTQMADNPDSEVQTLELIAPDEKLTLLQSFNDTHCEYDNATTLHARFEAQATATPDHIAVTDDHNTLTYAQLNARADQLAKLLRIKGVRPNQIVALMMPRSTDMMVAVLATLKAGGAYLPIDAGFPEERIRFMLGDSGARLLLTLSSMEVPGVDAVERLNLDKMRGMSADQAQPEGRVSSGPNDLAYVIYTSGSTGQPKGVMIEHHSVINRLQWMQDAYPLTEQDVLLQKTPYTFDVSVWELFWWFFAGARLSLLPPDGEKDPAVLIDRVARHGVTRMHFVPSMLSVFLDYLSARGGVDSLTSLSQVICSGEALMPAQVTAFHELLSGRRLSNLYGPTEATVDVSFFECSADLPADQPVPIGQPIANHRLYILSRSGRLQPIGVGGELCIAGVGLARGYLNRESLTAEKFIDNPLNPSERLYRTGDLARWRADGQIEYLGRIDHQVKVRGYRIELSEIEVQLQKQPDVAEAAVLAIKDNRHESTLCAFVTTPITLDIEVLNTRLRAILPEYMVPAHILVLDAMPLTANGKLDRRALMQQPLRFDSRQPFVAPTNEVEEALVEIWQQVLNQDSVSINDSFFDLGGDSIKAIRLIGLITKQMQRPLEIQQLYQQPTVKELALLLSGHTEADTQHSDLKDIHHELAQWKKKVLADYLPEQQSEVEDAYPLSDIGRGMISLSLTNTQDAVYHDQFVYQIHFPEFDDQRLKRALAFMVDKHEMLRARFYMEDEPFLAVFREVPVLPFESMDLRGVPSSDQEQRIKADLAEDRTWPFKLDQGPGWRMKVYRLEDQRAVVCWIFHHAVMDGWSIASFMTELMQVYDRERRGESIALPAERLRSGYRDFIADQYRVQRQPDITEFWRQELADYKRFPLDAFRDSDPSPKVVSTFLDADVLGRLREVAQRHHLPLKSLCFTAYALALHMFTEDREFVLGLVENNRPSVADGDKILGCFLNTIPFKVSVPDNASLKNLVEGIHDKVMRMKTFGRLSLVKIVEALNESFYGENPFFDVIFNYVDFHIYEQVGSEYQHEKVLDLNSYERTNTYLDVTISTTLNQLEIRMTSSLAKAVTQQMAEYCTRILQGMADDLEQPYNKATFMTLAERCHLLDEVNDTATDYPKDQPLQQLFEHQVECYADKAALRFGDAELSYDALNRQANRLAHALQQAGVGPGRVVGLLCDRSFAMVAATLGILKAGGAYLPIDPEYPEERQSFMLSDSDAQWLLLGDGQTSPEGYTGQIIELASVLDDATLDDTNPSTANHSDDIAYVMYTSGSTGTPKGIRTRHYNASRVVLNTNYIDFQPDDCVLQLFNYVFDGTTLDMYGALLNGATLRLVDREELLDARRLSARLRTGEISVFCITSALFNALVDWDPASLGFVRKVLFGGESVSVPHVRKALHHVSDDTLIHVYGPTESTVFATAHPVREVPDHATTVPIGTPIANTQVYVLDAGLRLQPLGVPGELCISGDGLAEGYLNQPERTAEAFVEHPFRPGERLYRTGDLARWRPDGTLEHLGRIDLQVKIRGHRIELGEIEHRLAQLEGVDDAIVIVQTHGGDKHLCAFVTGLDDLALPELRQQLARQLPDYMVPTHFEQLDAIPVTANGKADRNALAERQGSLQTGVEYVAPRTETEAQLIGLWREVLGLSDEASQPIGAYDHFFELGGHSLKATSLAAKIHRAFEVELPLKDLFAYPTVEEQAQRIEAGTSKRFTAIPQAEVKPYYPLSSAQKRLYVLSQMEGGDINYNMPGAVILDGPLRQEVLDQVLKALTQRHEALRTSFEVIEGEPVQRIHDSVSIPVRMIQPKDALTVADIAREFVQPFDLTQAPLFRVGLVPLDQQKHLLLFDMHHIISDGATMGVLINDIAALYRGETLEPLRVQYKDFSEWQNGLFQSDDIVRQRNYWLEQFADDLPVLDMPTDFPRPAMQGFAGATLDFALDRDQSDRLKRFAEQQGCTLFMVLMSAYSMALAKYSRQEDVIVGTPIAGRPHVDLEPVMGMFVNTLALRSQPQADKRYRDYLQEVKQQALNAYENQDCPFEDLVEQLDLRRDLSRNPLFDVMLILQNNDGGELDLGDLTLTSYEMENTVAKFDMTLVAGETDDGLGFRLEYRTRLFTTDTMTRFARHFQCLLEQLVAEPDNSVAELTMLSEDERRQILVDFNRTGTAFPKYETLQSLFEEQVDLNPHNTAVTFGGEVLTYQQLNARANRFARILRKRGVGTHRVVGLLCERSTDMIVAMLGVLKAGGVYLPIDPEYPTERIEFMLKDSSARWLVTQSGLEDRVRFKGELLLIDQVLSGTTQSGDNLYPVTVSGDLAYIMYTSGSTGQPKGIKTCHYNISRVVRNTNYIRFHHSDRVLQLSNYAFDGATFDIFGALLNGATLVMIERDDARDIRRLGEVLVQQEISVVCITTALFNTLVDLAPQSLSGVRKVLFGGEAISLPHVRKALDYVQPDTLIHVYGPTESTVYATAQAVDRIEADQRVLPIGAPIANTEVYVMDAALNLLPIGVPGELCIAGAGLAEGYLNRPEQNKIAFVEHPYRSGERLYRTGDLAKWRPDGTLQYLGRIDQQVKIRGHRIEPGEVESRLAALAPVNEACVLVRDTAEGEKYLCAYLTADTPQDPAGLREALAKHLPDYMLPTAWVQMERLPVTATGKLDRRALPEPDSQTRATEYVAPRNDTERQLVALWRDVLALDEGDAPGIHDNFFELGGHSLKATAMATGIHREFGVDVPLKTIFQSPTIAQLAQCIEQAGQSARPVIEPVGSQAYYPASPAQRSMFMVSSLGDGDTRFNLPGAVKLKGQLDVTRLDAVLNDLVTRHEPLRTRFETVNDQPVQIVVDAVNFGIEHLAPLTNEEAAEAEPFIRQRIADFVRPFDLTQAPLFRVGLLPVSEDEHILVFDVHHIVADGSTLGILSRELSALFNDWPLPELKVQYKDFAHWQNGLIETGALTKQQDYWLDVFSGELPVLELPLDFERQSSGEVVSDVLTRTLDRETTARLHQIASENGATPFMVLLAAYNILLAKYSGQDDIIVGSRIAGRQHAEIESAIGLFVNTIALRNAPQGHKTYTDFLQEVKQRSLQAYENQDYPFESLIDQLNLTREAGRSPLFNTLFSVQDIDVAPLDLGDLMLEPYDFGHELSRFDTTLRVSESDHELTLWLEYNTLLFKTETIERLLGHFHELLIHIAESPDRRIAELELMTAEERQRLTGELSVGPTQPLPETSVHEWFEQQVAASPDSVALVYRDQSLSYAELNGRANRLARRLRDDGVSPGKRVALLLDRSLDMITAMLAVMKAGGAYVPIDPQYPSDRIHFTLADSGANTLITETGHRALLEGYGGTVLCVDEPDWLNGDANAANNLNIEVAPSDLVYVIYTSGTTGQPKGVLVEHRSVVNLVKTMFEPIYQERPDYRNVAQLAPYVFDMSVKPIYGSLLFGRTLHLIPEAIRADGQSLHRYFAEHDIDWSDATPTYLSLLVNSVPDGLETSRVQQFVVGGEALSKARVKAVWERLGSHLLLTNVYGPTECTVDSTLYQISSADLDGPGVNLPIGRAMPNQSVWVLDADRRPVPPGVVGELYIGGTGVTRGYLNRDDLTAEKFVQLTALNGERAYRTGDLGRMRPDGVIDYLGRADSQVKIRGYRIELGEIESRIKQQAGVNDAVVVARDEIEGKVLVAYYVSASGESLAPALRQALSQCLPYYMVPTHFVRLDALPRTANGKLDESALPKPEIESADDATATGPRDAIEEQLVALWQEMLNLDSVGITDRFFEIGGHSLNAIMLLARIKKQFQVDIPLNELFMNPTIEFLAGYIRQAESDGFAAIEPAPQQDYYPLSSSQRRLYLLQQIGGANTSYNMPVTVAVEGDLDRQRLATAFNALVQRHEALRTSFELVDGEPVQRVHAEAPVEIERLDFPVDLRAEALHSEPVKQAVEKLLAGFIRPFDLAQAPMIRVGLVEKTEREYILIIDMHHIVSDAVTNGILVREFSQLYNGQELPELRIHYKDYSHWQQQLFQSEEMERQQNYWLETLAGELPVLDLPTDYHRPPIQSTEGDSLHFELGAELSRKLSELAGRTESTLYMVLLSAYSLLLCRYSGQEDIVVGSPIAGRRHADLENVVGVFINTLAMRNRPTSGKTYRQYLREVKENALQAFDCQDYPFEDVVEQLKVDRDPSRNPIFDTMFTMKNTRQDAEVELDGLRLSPYQYQATTSKFDLSLDAAETELGIVLGLEYCTRLFTRSRMERLVQHLITLLEDITQKPDATLAELNILTAGERRRILEQFNSPTLTYPTGPAVHQRLEQWARECPNEVALVQGDRQWTFGQLNAEANRLARVLVARGIGVDTPVAIYMERSLEMVQSIIAVWKAGGCYVPVDPEHPISRSRDILIDSDARLVLTKAAYCTTEFTEAYNGLLLKLDEAAESIAAEDDTNLDLAHDPNQLAYVLYTSGSTGKPKGAMLEHAGMNNHIDVTVAEFGLDRTSVIAQNAPHCFDISVWQLVTGSAIGAKTVIYNNDLILDVADFVERVKQDRVTVLELVVSYMSTILDLDSPALPDIQHLLVTGEPIQPDLVCRWFRHYPDIKLVNAYGPTEAADDVTFHTMEAPETGGVVPVGQPVDNLNIYIVDRDMNLQPVGVKGELCVAGVGVGRGYLNRPELTEQVFLQDPFVQNSGVRLYKTGDLANWRDDGNIEFHGRIDYQVKIRGHRIELGEIEAAILDQESVAEVVVIDRDGGQTKYLCAYYVKAKDTTATDLRHALAQRLPDYMVPAHFMELSELPLTPNGKIDRKALPEPERQSTDAKQAPPRNETEQLLVDIWQGVLGLEQIGIEDSFFDLGGDSIKGIQMAARLNQAGYKLDVQDLFQYPRISELGNRIVPVNRLIDQSPVVGEAGLTPVQAWFFEQNFSEYAHWNQSLMLHRPDGFDESRLRQVFDHLVQHHDALRSVFEPSEDGYRLRNRAPDASHLYSLERFDGRQGLDTEEAQRDFVMQHANAVQASLDIHNGPLLKLGLFTMPDGDHLLIAVHHLVIDGVSWRILLEDIGTAYSQLRAGGDITLPPKTDAYLHWSQRLNDYAGNYANKDATDTVLDYWAEVAGQEQPALPKDRVPEVTPLVSDSAACSVALDEADTQRLLTEANKAYNTEINDLLMAALGLAVSDWASLGHVVVNLEGHGREPLFDDIDISRTVGWFTCEYPVVLDIREEELAIQIKRVKETLHRVPNRGMDYGLLKYLARSEQTADWSLHPEISFNYLGQFDEQVQDSPDIGLSSHPNGALIGPGNQRSYPLGIVAMKMGGKLQINIDYSPSEYDAQTVQRLAESFTEQLRRVIDHCTGKESTELTPSDMTFKGLSMDALQALEDDIDSFVQEDDL